MLKVWECFQLARLVLRMHFISYDFSPLALYIQTVLCDSVCVYVCVECMGELIGEMWGRFLEKLWSLTTLALTCYPYRLSHSDYLIAEIETLFHHIHLTY